MASIVSTGVGSGLDIAGLVDKLVQAEGQPKSLRLDRDEAKAQSRLSALGSLRSALASFRDTLGVLQDAARFQGRQVTLSAPEFVSASATTGAVPGTYTIAVEQLAQAHKVQSQPTDATAGVGTGTLTIAVGGETFDVAVDAENNTVAGLAAAINSSAAGSKVVATVISGTEGAVLSLTARATGTANAMEISQTGGDAELAAFVGALETVQTATDAVARIDGVEVTSASNTLSAAIIGVDITLTKAHEDDETTQLTVSFDRKAARKSIDDFVKAYNGIIDTVKALSSYNAETRVGGPLFGDAGLRNIVFQLRRELSAATAGVDAARDTLNELGITADIDGKLSVDGVKLDAAFDADFDGVGRLFGAEGSGLAVRLDALLDP